jgi:hypothetical protein
MISAFVDLLSLLFYLIFGNFTFATELFEAFELDCNVSYND